MRRSAARPDSDRGAWRVFLRIRHARRGILMNRILRSVGTAFVLARTAHAQTPLMFSELVRPATAMDAKLRAAVHAQAGKYALEGVGIFGRDSIVLVFADSAYTDAGHTAGTWMFGPRVTDAEADGCPPEKVLGRKIARALFRAMGRPAELRQIAVSVHGTVGADRWSGVDMYYYPGQLSGKWSGDRIPW